MRHLLRLGFGRGTVLERQPAALLQPPAQIAYFGRIAGCAHQHALQLPRLAEGKRRGGPHAHRHQLVPGITIGILVLPQAQRHSLEPDVSPVPNPSLQAQAPGAQHPFVAAIRELIRAPAGEDGAGRDDGAEGQQRKLRDRSLQNIAAHRGEQKEDEPRHAGLLPPDRRIFDQDRVALGRHGLAPCIRQHALSRRVRAEFPLGVERGRQFVDFARRAEPRQLDPPAYRIRGKDIAMRPAMEPPHPFPRNLLPRAEKPEATLHHQGIRTQDQPVAAREQPQYFAPSQNPAQRPECEPEQHENARCQRRRRLQRCPALTRRQAGQQTPAAPDQNPADQHLADDPECQPDQQKRRSAEASVAGRLQRNLESLKRAREVHGPRRDCSFAATRTSNAL